jgi:alanyl-tRNA synthetase
MGLERIAAVMQGVHSNYEIDLFQALIRAPPRHRLRRPRRRRCGSSPTTSAPRLPGRRRRAPGNEGRGYVQRRIIRRAIRHGYSSAPRACSSGINWSQPLADEMGDAYPELRAKQPRSSGAARPRRSVRATPWSRA